MKDEAARWVVICNPDSGSWFAAEWTPGAGVSDSVACRDRQDAARVCRERLLTRRLAGALPVR